MSHEKIGQRGAVVKLVEKIILAIETSCDETACALYGENRGLLREQVYSQWRQHAAYGGIVPEVASREHSRRLLYLIDKILFFDDFPTMVAYTRGPGLAGALLTGAAIANAFAFSHQLPIVGINHLEGHLLSPQLLLSPPSFPYIALLISGGHSQLWWVIRRGHYRLLGQTLDDAAGEAFDKVAILLGLGYPGGARLEHLAKTGDSQIISLPSPAQADYNFSFSGLKTAVRRISNQISPADIAATFQRVVAEGLAKQATRALLATSSKNLVVVGGVAQNNTIAKHLSDSANHVGADFTRPSARHCGDNAAMIAVAALHHKPKSAGSFDVEPRWQPS